MKIDGSIKKIGGHIFRVFENIFINMAIIKNRTNDIRCKVPPTTKFSHGISIVIGKDVKLGKNILINQGVTIGQRHGKQPTIEDNVKIKANATIIGDIKIGHDSIIGAGAVVIDNVPPYSVVVGVPGKVVKKLEN